VEALGFSPVNCEVAALTVTRNLRTRKPLQVRQQFGKTVATRVRACTDHETALGYRQ
jgi:hypothetical protein